MAIPDTVGSVGVLLGVLRDENFENRSKFYQDLGFQNMNDPENADRVYLGMNDIRATLGASQS